MEIILVRHAQSLDNANNLFSGTTESKLSDLGQTQAQKLARHLAKTVPQISQICSSPQARAIETAQTIAGNFLISQIVQDPRLVEVNLGDWEGLSLVDIKSRYGDQLSQWDQDPETLDIPNAEKLPEATDRIYEFMEHKYQEFPQGRIIVVSHSLLIRCLLTKLLIRPLKDIWMFDIDNAGYSTIEWDAHPQVVEINQTDHLATDQDLE